MPTKRKSQVFIFGNGSAAYRPAAYLKFLYDRPDEFAVISISGDSFAQFPKFLRIPLRIITGVFALIGSDYLLIQPMNHSSPYARFLHRAARVFGKKAVVDFYISSFETRVIDRKLTPANSPAAEKLKLRDQTAFLMASKVIFLNSAEADYYQHVLSIQVPKEKQCFAPLVVPQRPQASLPYLNEIADMMTVAWWGREGNPLHGFDVIAEAMRSLLASADPIRFALFPAGGKDFAKFRDEFKDILEHPSVFTSTEHTFNNGKLLEYCLSNVDIALGTFGKTQKAKTVLTNKVLDASSMGIPCITQPSGGLMEYYEPSQNILLCEESPEALADALRKALNSRDDLIEMGKRVRELCEATFSPSAHEKRLAEIFQ